jgi:hypothetical protein
MSPSAAFLRTIISGMFGGRWSKRATRRPRAAGSANGNRCRFLRASTGSPQRAIACCCNRSSSTAIVSMSSDPADRKSTSSVCLNAITDEEASKPPPVKDLSRRIHRH